MQGDLLDPLPEPVDLVVANLPYLPESEHDSRYDDEPEDAVYAPGDGLGPYRRLLDACRDGKLQTGGIDADPVPRPAAVRRTAGSSKICALELENGEIELR